MSNRQAIKANQYPGTMLGKISLLTNGNKNKPVRMKTEQQFMIPKQPMNDK